MNSVSLILPLIDSIIQLINCILMVIAAFFLILGSERRNPNLLLPWLIEQVLTLILIPVIGIRSAIADDWSTFAVCIIAECMFKSYITFFKLETFLFSIFSSHLYLLLPGCQELLQCIKGYSQPTATS